MKENIKIGLLVLAVLSIISLYFFSNKQSIENIPLCMLGYYEATPSFLEISDLYSMSLILDNTTCRIMLESKEDEDLEEVSNIQEIDFELCDFKKDKSKEDIVNVCCRVESDSDHPMCGDKVFMAYNINSGELIIKKNNIIIANLVKDNMISLYL